ncbi:MAG: hypothetical protein QNK20_16560 [Aureibaculum sp.]|nr:hypothetical protein [Aureibaculum sp.]
MSDIIESGLDILEENQTQTTELQTLNTNGAKEAKQDAANALLTTIDADTGNIATDTASIDAKVSTEAKQDDIITAINAIEAGGTKGDAATSASVAASATTVLLLAANTNRVSAYIRNDSNRDMYIEYEDAATLTSAIKLTRQSVIIIDDTTAAINGIWAAGATGNARITENVVTP